MAEHDRHRDPRHHERAAPDARSHPRPELDARLAQGRVDLLSRIDQPPLARLRDRAAARRRRRHALAITGGALLTALAATAVTVLPWTGTTDRPTNPPIAPAVDPPVPDGPVYTAAGITLHGLTERSVHRVPGTISDVEFVDPRHGYLLARCPSAAPCQASVARTDDGGLTWHSAPLPADSAGASELDLLAFGGGRLLVTGTAGTYASADHGRTWRVADHASAGPPVLPAPGDLLRAGAGDGACRRDIEVWRPAGRAGLLANRPDLDVCWVAPAATPDGAWWVGGLRDGAATVAMTRDHGAHWRLTALPWTAPGPVSVEVTSLGRQAYAAVLAADRSLLALFHSPDGGAHFVRVGAGGAPPPGGLAGAVVPLLDGRLLVTGTDQRWYVSADDGATFTRAEGTLPAVGRLTRTRAGYVAHGLFGGGWAAYSADGVEWRKLQVN